MQENQYTKEETLNTPQVTLIVIYVIMCYPLSIPVLRTCLSSTRTEKLRVEIVSNHNDWTP